MIISILQYAAIKSDYFLFVLTQKVTWEGTLNVFFIHWKEHVVRYHYAKIQKIWMGFHMWKECRVFFFEMWKYAMADYKISSYHLNFLFPKSQNYLEKSHKIVSFWKSMLWSVYETKITCFLLIYRFWSSLGWILPINTKNFKNILPPKDYFLQGS